MDFHVFIHQDRYSLERVTKIFKEEEILEDYEQEE